MNAGGMKPTAVVGRRVVAFLIDGLILAAVNAALFFALADTDEELTARVLSGDLDPDANVFVNLTLGDSTYSVTGGKAALFFLATFVVWFLYWVVWQGLKGVTVGKALTGIRLVRNDGSAPGMWKSFVRQFLWIVDSFPYLIPYLTGFITAMVSKNNRRVGDMVAGTLVVKKAFAGAAASPGESSSPPPPASESPAPPTPAPTPSTPANWYPDPSGEKRLRYWDGSAWTDHTAD
jgi:uncharacterized RDD family membrane protein YckC